MIPPTFPSIEKVSKRFNFQLSYFDCRFFNLPNWKLSEFLITWFHCNLTWHDNHFLTISKNDIFKFFVVRKWLFGFQSSTYDTKSLDITIFTICQNNFHIFTPCTPSKYIFSFKCLIFPRLVFTRSKTDENIILFWLIVLNRSSVLNTGLKTWTRVSSPYLFENSLISAYFKVSFWTECFVRTVIR